VLRKCARLFLTSIADSHFLVKETTINGLKLNNYKLIKMNLIFQRETVLTEGVAQALSTVELDLFMSF
jgi:hypothetical protein